MSDDPRSDGPTDPWGRPMPAGGGWPVPPAGPVPPTSWPPSGSPQPPPRPPGAPPQPPTDDWWGAPEPGKQSPPDRAVQTPGGFGTPPAQHEQAPWPGGPPPAAPYQGPPQREGKAVGALVLGIASVVCCGILGIPFGIGAIVTGTTSRKRIAASSGRLEGDGTALAGIIIGVVGLVLSTLATIYLFTNPDALNELVETLETTTTTSSPPR